MNNVMHLNIVKGNEGYCLNLVDDCGDGERILGCKPWGNPFNTATFSFELSKEELKRLSNLFNYYAENKMK